MIIFYGCIYILIILLEKSIVSQHNAHISTCLYEPLNIHMFKPFCLSTFYLVKRINIIYYKKYITKNTLECKEKKIFINKNKND